MNLDARPAFGKGVRLRYDQDGGAMLLIPEGALMLNRVAAAALALIDGERTLGEIVTEMTGKFDVDETLARDDVGDLFQRLADRRLLSL